MDLSQLISGLDLRVVGDAAGVRVCDITEDSRTAVPGSLFIARAGLAADGRKFVAPAVKCGAVAVLSDSADLDLDGVSGLGVKPVVLVSGDVARDGAVLAERFYGSPSSRLAVVGVTGTNGKTSVATMTRAVLNAADVRCGLIGTVEIDDGREVAPAGMTTPPAVELSRTLATMVDSGCRAAAIEVSSHALDQRRAEAVRFAVGVFTNITGDHLDYHKTPEAYLAAKRRLFELLPEDGVRVLNADDPASAVMNDAARGGSVRWCSGKGDGRAPWIVSIESAEVRGMTLAIGTPIGAVRGRVGLVGAHNAMNVLQALAASDAVLERAGLGAEARLGALRAGLVEIRPARGRLELVSGAGDDVTVFVDFAHTDDAMRSTLGAVRGVIGEARLCVVFGCGGDRDATKRPRMGAAAAELADRVIVTSDNPRRESPGAIIDAILSGMPEETRSNAIVHADRGRAIREAVMGAGDGEVIVIAGKGHETQQISSDGAGGLMSRHFDDAEEARRVLRERRLRAGSKGGVSA